MESQKALLEVVEDQKRTIEKYTNKLRDVVAAHKSLLSEKKALEDVVKTLSAERVSKLCNKNSIEEKISESNATDSSEGELKNQLSSLTAAMSSLVAEKSHMEIGFKSKQKQLLEDKEKAENKCEELEQQVKALMKQLSYVENKSSNENFQQKKNSLISLRSSKQTTDKDKLDIIENESLAVKVKNYEQEIKNLKIELEAKQIVQESSEKKLLETCKELNRLQEDFKNFQIEHEMAISAEKEKAKNIEEDAKKLIAVQEKQVCNLEARLTELSETIGMYDRLRLQGQMEVQKLKEHIAFIDMGTGRSTSEPEKSEMIDLNEYDSLKEKFLDTLKNLKLAAQKHSKEEDLKNLLVENSDIEETHLQCKEEYAKLEAEFKCFKKEVKKENGEGNSGKVVDLENEIINLKKKIIILSDKNKKIISDYNLQIGKLKTSLKNEKERFKKMKSASEADQKAKVWLLEEQLQKQRERSVALLEEKDQEIQALQSSFQKFLPGYRRNSEEDSPEESNMLTKNEFDGPHIVHYANELARKDIEISSLRKSKQQIERQLRILQKDTVLNEEIHKEEKNSLLNKIKRLERCQTKVGGNVEYLRFVVYNFLESDDPKWKSHLCKAIASVLKFSDAELENVIRKNKYK